MSLAGYAQGFVNQINYKLAQLAHDPEAEKLAEKQRKEKEEAEQRKKANEKKDAEDAQAAAEAKAKKEKEDAEEAKRRKEEEERADFKPDRFAKRVGARIAEVVAVFLLVVLGVLGASLATNLNLYKSTPYRILYAIWGFAFFFIVVPYCLLYRWWWNGRRPRFYALLPFIPYRLNNKYAVLLFSWLSYKPDNQIDSLREWLEEQYQCLK